MEKFITVDGQDGAKFVQSIEDIYSRAQEIKIETADGYVEVAEELKILKAKQKEITEKRMDMTRPLDTSKKNIMDFFRHPLDLIAKAESFCKNEMVKWNIEQDRLRQIEEDRIQAQAKKDSEKLQKKADLLEEKGDARTAHDLRNEAQAIESSMPTVTDQETKVAGISRKKVWKFKITDESLLSRNWLIPDEKKIGATVRATQGSILIEGVHIYSEDSIASGGR